jgi:hypothetical protein
LKKSLPKKWHISRIENRFGGGIPDVYICADGKPFWLELKVTKNHRVSISSHQIAWHFAHSQSNGVSFFLVKTLLAPTLYLFDGVHGRELLDQGLRVGIRGPGSGTGVQDSGFPVGDSGSGSGTDDSGSGISGRDSGADDSGSGFGLVVPCAWAGDDYAGLVEFLVQDKKVPGAMPGKKHEQRRS